VILPSPGVRIKKTENPARALAGPKLDINKARVITISTGAAHKQHVEKSTAVVHSGDVGRNVIYQSAIRQCGRV